MPMQESMFRAGFCGHSPGDMSGDFLVLVNDGVSVGSQGG